MDPRSSSFDPHPSTDAGYETARAHLRAEFAGWAERNGTDVDPDSFDQLVHYKWGYLDGYLTRWTRHDLDTILLELFPAKVIVDDDDLDDIIVETSAFIAFLADTRLLDPRSDDPHTLDAHLQQLTGRFHQAMADTSRYSPGKRFWQAATATGIRPDDQDAVTAFMHEFNSRPGAERDAVLGDQFPTTPSRRPSGRFTPPGTHPQPTQRRRRRR